MKLSHGFSDPLNDAILQSEALFAQAAAISADHAGVTRMAYGESESRMLGMLAAHARTIGLEISTDLAGNLYMTLPGTDRDLPVVLTGSHADSVPQGGNYDGLAGILAGLACLEAFSAQGFQPQRDITVAAFRGEENAWFGAQHLGSRAALGLLDPALLNSARRIPDDRPLAQCMRDVGLDPDALVNAPPHLSPARVKCYLEAHIEQGPVLIHAQVPVGVVTGIRGNVRCARASCLGEYGHAGVVPLAMRKDAVVAVSALVTQMQAQWQQWAAQGQDLVMTFGKCQTDAAAHAVTTIAGKVDFSFEARSHDPHLLATVRDTLLQQAQALSDAYGVMVSFGPWTEGAPAAMDARLMALASDALQARDLPHYLLASGAGHDAQDFIAAGIPAAMLFIRNANGSHNPDEAMEIDDYAAAVGVLRHMLEVEST